MLLWARHQLTHQVALHSAAPPSAMLDSDQLGWSLAIFLRFEQNFHSSLENQDLIKQALKSLFLTQVEVGTWRHYKPLFHYAQAGNAYCYVFETFAVLLQAALRSTPEAEIARELLKPYSENLLRLWKYAESTKIPIGTDLDKFGWCSGHRTNVTWPESWATASVFSYAQALRGLYGIWSREEAGNALRTLHSHRSRKQAAADLANRGESWGSKKSPVSEQLWSFFINPVRTHECNDRLEPDSQPIAKNHARSAILFGPPGTSKTSLIRALADVIDWHYVEIHASHFVREGLGQVQKTADEIFKQLSELDHTVVLFDEIDELVRERDMEKDAFGRFLTTSMLPKLAELWEARKILYFVATNHINYFDSAIIRSHRFDALIFVSPPSFDSKIKRLKELLQKNYGLSISSFQSTEADVEEVLELFREDAEKLATESRDEQEKARETALDEHRVLAKFALLRFDELNELAAKLASIQKPKESVVSTDSLVAALSRVSDSEWRKTKSYLDYMRDSRSERRDFQMVSIWEIVEIPDGLRNSSIEKANGLSWLVGAVGSAGELKVPGVSLKFDGQGKVKVTQRRRAGAPAKARATRRQSKRDSKR